MARPKRIRACPEAFEGLGLWLYQQKQRLERKQFERSHADEDRHPTDGMLRRNNLQDTNIERRSGICEVTTTR